jgi:hypothetical protein
MRLIFDEQRCFALWWWMQEHDDADDDAAGEHTGTDIDGDGSN